jgi:hypothetical protein
MPCCSLHVYLREEREIRDRRNETTSGADQRSDRERDKNMWE